MDWLKHWQHKGGTVLTESDEARGKRYVTPTEAEKLLAERGMPVQARTIRTWIRKGKVAGVKPAGGRVYVDWWALMEIVDKDTPPAGRQ